jgi:hypothetical protein
MLKILMVFVLSCSSFAAFADLPQNDLWKQDTGFAANFTEKEFNAAIKELQTLYAPIIANFGAKLSIKGDWKDSTVNAYASQNGNVWNVQMFGGLARRPETTIDGFKLVICHELGHHLGGAPASGWAAFEGQADIYATYVCGKKIFANYSQQVQVNPYCNNGTDKDRIACTVNLNAGLSLANLLAALAGDEAVPSYSTFDPTVVSETQSEHPRAQCRLDSYFAGEMCNMPWNDKVIPKNEDSFCDTRPRCWFHPS